MASYTGIAAVSEKLKRSLQEALVPQLASSEGRIALCSPADEADVAAGIFLYDIQECEHMRSHTMVNVSDRQQMRPPLYLTLSYMITVYAAGDIRFRGIQEKQMLGRVIQYLYDHPVFEHLGEQIVIQMERISTEDKIKLWNFPNVPYRASLFYRLFPIPVESEFVREVDRVRKAEIRVN